MKITEYVKEVKVEMSHVSWPTKKQTIFFTAVVILLSLGMAVFLGLTDFLLKIGFGKLI